MPGTYLNYPFDISIHTLHTEGDSLSGGLYAAEWISIHTLHTEGDNGIGK